MRRQKAYQSVESMPFVMRTVCECLAANEFRRGQHWDTRKIAKKLNITPATVQMHIGRAMRATGTHGRKELAEWCMAGRHVRNHSDPPPQNIIVPFVAAYNKISDKKVHVPIDLAIHALLLAYPLETCSAVSRFRESAEGQRRLADARQDRADAMRPKRLHYAPVPAPEPQPEPQPAPPMPEYPTGPITLEMRRQAKLRAYRAARGLPPLPDTPFPSQPGDHDLIQ